MEKSSYATGMYALVCKTLVLITSDFGDAIFKTFPGKYVPGSPRTRSDKGSLLGQSDTTTVNIFSRVQDCSLETNFPILKNSAHKPTSREIYFC